MKIYPAIDIQNGKAVRLKQGDFDRIKIYDDPVQAAKKWEKEGAEYLHVVDLDGAKKGMPQNLSTVSRIVEAVNIPVQLGGGLRDVESIREAFLTGVSRVIIGTVLIYNPNLAQRAVDEFGPEKIVAGVDVKNGNLSVEGWQKSSNQGLEDFLLQLQEMGIKNLVVTDIDSDGMQSGPNVDLMKHLLEATHFTIIASGGITTIRDIKRLSSLKAGDRYRPRVIEGGIIGTALYEGTINIKTALRSAMESDLTVRIIPCLDVDQGRVVKGINFVNIKDAGDPVELAEAYDREGADELVFLDITASHEKRKTMVEVAGKVAEKVFIPYTVGGGIRTLDDIKELLLTGCDKVAINTAAVEDPEFVKKAAQKFGSQCIVVAIDAKKKGDSWEVYINGGRKATGKDALEWAKQMEEFGAGELLLTSMDRDGTKEGFDIDLTGAVTGIVNIPVIASGGAGKLEHFAEVYERSDADALLAASLFHYGELKINTVKEFLKSKNIPVREI